MSAPRVTAAALEQLRITEKTVWSFVRLATSDGRVGFGEASIPSRHDAVQQAADDWLASVAGLPATRADVGAVWRDRPRLADAAVGSALDMALYDLEGQERGLPIHALLGGARREEIALYANINRTTVDRSPQGFAATARRAAAQGFTAFKLAPFDELSPAQCEGPAFPSLLQRGLDRVAAVREAVGAAATLRVDCHWRFTAAGAAALIEAAPPLALDWIECPIPETAANAAAIATLRREANRQGIRLAGLEMGTGLAAFAPFLEARAYDVIMPDVKYLGGLALMMDLAALAHANGAVLSLHNPTGPVSHAASLHVCAALPVIDTLEMQFDESPLFDALLDGPAFASEGGVCAVPQTPGLGAALAMRCVEDLRLESPA